MQVNIDDFFAVNVYYRKAINLLFKYNEIMRIYYVSEKKHFFFLKKKSCADTAPLFQMVILFKTFYFHELLKFI
jgi:hypothetical protein